MFTHRYLVLLAGLALAAPAPCYAKSTVIYTDANSIFEDCSTNDANDNIKFLKRSRLRASQLIPFCHCRADYNAPYINSDRATFLTKLIVSDFVCASKLGGKFY